MHQQSLLGTLIWYNETYANTERRMAHRSMTNAISHHGQQATEPNGLNRQPLPLTGGPCICNIAHAILQARQNANSTSHDDKAIIIHRQEQRQHFPYVHAQWPMQHCFAVVPLTKLLSVASTSLQAFFEMDVYNWQVHLGSTVYYIATD